MGVRRSPKSRASSCGTCSRPLEGAGEELVDAARDIVAALETAPDDPNQPDELVAHVDRNDEGDDLGGRTPDQQRFDIGRQCRERRDRAFKGSPRFEWQRGFGGAGRARIKRCDETGRTVAEEKRQANRDVEQFPGLASVRKLRQYFEAG